MIVPPKSQERPNGRVRGRALWLALPDGERSAAWPFLKDMQVGSSSAITLASWSHRGRPRAFRFRRIWTRWFQWARFPLRRRRKQSDRGSPFRRQALCNDLRLFLQDHLDGGGQPLQEA